MLHESGLPLAACRGCAKPQPFAPPRSSRNDRFFVHVPRELQGLGFMRRMIEFEAGLVLPQSRASSGNSSFMQHDHRFPNTTRHFRLFLVLSPSNSAVPLYSYLYTSSIRITRQIFQLSYYIQRRSCVLYTLILANIVTILYQNDATVSSIILL